VVGIGRAGHLERYINSLTTGQMVPLSSFVKYDTQHVTFLSINHQGQFPAVTLSFNLAPGAALGDAVAAINRAAALLAALPWMLGQGTGSELRRSLGFTMVGGLLLSQALTLFSTAVIYLTLDRFSDERRAQRVRGARVGSGAVQATADSQLSGPGLT